MRDVVLHPHARDRANERGATEGEIVQTVRLGESFVAKRGRLGFRRDFATDVMRRGRQYATKQIEAIAVEEDGRLLVLTVIVKYF